MAKRRLTAAEYAKRWKNGATGAGERYKEGVQSVTESPMAKAAAAASKMLTGVQDAVNSGYYAERCNATSIEDWKRKSTGKGALNYANGVNQAEADVTRAAGPLLTEVYNARDEALSMPGDTLDQRLARANAYARRMAAYKKGR